MAINVGYLVRVGLSLFAIFLIWTGLRIDHRRHQEDPSKFREVRQLLMASLVVCGISFVVLAVFFIQWNSPRSIASTSDELRKLQKESLGTLDELQKQRLELEVQKERLGELDKVQKERLEELDKVLSQSEH
jgi:hypothetical protein